MESPVFLRYLFNGWIVEFRADHIEMVNPFTRDRYKIDLEPYAQVPFLIQLLEKGNQCEQR